MNIKVLSSSLLGFGFFPLALLFLSGCGGKEMSAGSELKTASDHFEIKIGDKTARLQFAVTALEQQHGLMNRKDLGPNDGMIFVYARPQLLGFWMRSTPTPLDIAFFDEEGVLKEIYAMHPFDETPVKSRSNRLKFAIEMNQGWYRNNEVRPGARLDMKAVAAAMKARGISPQQWGSRE